MTAAPVNMHVVDHHSIDVATWVIQSHVLAMYLPSLVSGRMAGACRRAQVRLGSSSGLGSPWRSFSSMSATVSSSGSRVSARRHW